MLITCHMQLINDELIIVHTSIHMCYALHVYYLSSIMSYSSLTHSRTQSIALIRSPFTRSLIQSSPVAMLSIHSHVMSFHSILSSCHSSVIFPMGHGHQSLDELRASAYQIKSHAHHQSVTLVLIFCLNNSYDYMY